LHQKGLFSEGQRKPGQKYRAIMDGLVAQMDALDAAVKEAAHNLPDMPTDAKRRLSKVGEGGTRVATPSGCSTTKDSTCACVDVTATTSSYMLCAAILQSVDGTLQLEDVQDAHAVRLQDDSSAPSNSPSPPAPSAMRNFGGPQWGATEVSNSKGLWRHWVSINVQARMVQLNCCKVASH
jgi:hypothetical protein